MASSNLVLSAPLTSSAAMLKNLLIIAGCTVGLSLLLVVVTLLIYPLFNVRKFKFHIKPFVVAPELDSKISVVIEAALREELQRAAVLKSRTFQTSHEQDEGGIDIVTTVPDSLIGMSKPSVSYDDQTDNDLHSVLRGLRYAGFNPVVRRLKEIKFEVGDPVGVGQYSEVSSGKESLDITDAVIVNGGSTKILPIKLLMKIQDWKPKRFETEVCCNVRYTGKRLRITATLTPKPIPLFRRWTSDLRQWLSTTSWRLPGLRQEAETVIAGASLPSEPHPLPPSKLTVYECSIELTSSESANTQAAMIGVELAHKLLVGKQNANWQALEHYMNAITSYDFGMSCRDPAKLRQAVDHATKALSITHDLENLPNLMIATSDALSTFHELDAAEQALRIIPLHGSSHFEGSDKQEKEIKLLELRLRTLVRLGIVCYQKGDYPAGHSALQQAEKLSVKEDYIKRRIYPILAANLARIKDGDEHRDKCNKLRAVELLRCHLNFIGKSDSYEMSRNLGDQLGKVSLHDLALEAYEEAKKAAPCSSYLLWRCGVMRSYLVSDAMRPERDQRSALEQKPQSAMEHFRQAKKELTSASSGVETVVLLPGRRRRPDADPDVEAWYKLEALNDLAIMSSSVGVLSALASGTKAINRAGRFHGKAQTYIERAEKVAPNEWDVQYNSGLILQRKLETEKKDPGERDGAYDRVKHAYKAAIKLAPTEVISYLAMATLLDHEGAHETAKSHFEAARTNAVARHDFDVKAIVTLCAQGQARVLEKLARFDEAVGVLQAQVVWDPRTPELWQYLGFLKLKRAVAAGKQDCDQALQDIWRSRDIAASTAARQGSEQAKRTKAVMQFADEVEGIVYSWTGRHGLAELHFMRCKSWSEYACASLSAMAHVSKDYHAMERWAEEARKLRSRREAQIHSNTPKAEAYYRACIAAMIGATEEAFSNLRTALLWQPALESWARLDPDLRRVAGDARFKTLLNPRRSAP